MKCSASSDPGAWSPQEGHVSKDAAIVAVSGVLWRSVPHSIIFALAFRFSLANLALRPFAGREVFRPWTLDVDLTFLMASIGIIFGAGCLILNTTISPAI